MGRVAPTLSLSLSLKFRFVFITADKLFKEPYHFFILNPLGKERKQDLVIDIVKKLLYIAFEGVARSRIILTFFSKHIRHHINAFMASFLDPAGKRVSNECIFKQGIKDAENRVMDNAIPYGRLMYMSPFRVADKEPFVRTMSVGFIPKLVIYFEDMRFQLKFKICNIGP